MTDSQSNPTEQITDTATLHSALGRGNGLRDVSVSGGLHWPEHLEGSRFERCRIGAEHLGDVDFEGTVFVLSLIHI